MVPQDLSQPARRTVLAALASLAVSAPALGQAVPSVSGSLAYDRLDLSTPDAALRTFLTAYRDGDYVTAFWVFAADTQDEVLRHAAQLNLRRLARMPAQGGMAIMAEMLPPHAELDQRDSTFLFANIMQVAKRRGLLPLDVAGLPQDLSPANVPNLGRRTETTDGTTEIAVTLGAYRAPVVFRFIRARTGRWRLRQIVPPGGDPTSVPFGL
jgi:hypothetical protein